MSKGQLECPSKKRGSGGRRQKKNLEKEQGAQAVPKKKRQQRVESPEETTLPTKVVRVTPSQRAKWRPLPKSSREQLESMMHWLITSLLYETTENQSEIEKHLNLLKERLLKRFETLRVPERRETLEKLSSLKNVHKIVAEEKKKRLLIKEGLAELQNEIDRVLPETEFRDENIQSLHNKVQELKCELAEEEAAAAASKLFQRDGSDDLALPDLPKDHLKAPILQNELLKIGDQQGLLDDLNTIQQSDEMKAMLAFLEQAYENVDF